MAFTKGKFSFVILLSLLLGAFGQIVQNEEKIMEEEHGVVYANPCEACKILATELEARLSETGRSHDVLELG